MLSDVSLNPATFPDYYKDVTHYKARHMVRNLPSHVSAMIAASIGVTRVYNVKMLFITPATL